MSDAQIEAAARNLETTAKIDQFSSILFGAVAPEGEPREALAALVTYARDREAEAERHTKLLEEQRAQILDMEDQLDQASPNNKPPNSPPGVEYVSELEDMVELLEAENQKLLDKAQSRRKALKEAQAELAKTQEALDASRTEAERAKNDLAIARQEQASLRKTLTTKEQHIEELEEELVVIDEELREARSEGTLQCINQMHAIDARPARQRAPDSLVDLRTGVPRRQRAGGHHARAERVLDVETRVRGGRHRPLPREVPLGPPPRAYMKSVSYTHLTLPTKA